MSTVNVLNPKRVLLLFSFRISIIQYCIIFILLEVIYILCFSLIMLSKDFECPQIKNKMSKREFIRNTRQATRQVIDAELLGHLYDNVYLEGNIAVGNSVSPTEVSQKRSYPFPQTLAHARARSPTRPFRRIPILGGV